MTIDEAKKLCASLSRQAFGGTIKAKVEQKWSTDDPAVVFTGGKYGEAQIWLSVSPEARIRAHFAGYCAANGLALAPHVGQGVVFPSASSKTGTRFGHVTKVGPKRAVVAFTYKHGGKATKTVPFAELRFGEIR